MINPEKPEKPDKQPVTLTAIAALLDKWFPEYNWHLSFCNPELKPEKSEYLKHFLFFNVAAETVPDDLAEVYLQSIQSIGYIFLGSKSPEAKFKTGVSILLSEQSSTVFLNVFTLIEGEATPQKHWQLPSNLLPVTSNSVTIKNADKNKVQLALADLFKATRSELKDLTSFMDSRPTETPEQETDELDDLEPSPDILATILRLRNVLFEIRGQASINQTQNGILTYTTDTFHGTVHQDCILRLACACGDCISFLNNVDSSTTPENFSKNFTTWTRAYVDMIDNEHAKDAIAHLYTHLVTLIDRI